MQQFDPKNLDKNVVNLAKAIRKHETGNRPIAGQTGELPSRYQYLPETWKGTAQKYLGDANAPLTAKNEDQTTYMKIKDWKDAGYTPKQIASMWNSGQPDWEGKVGYSTKNPNVKYDVPKYVNAVYNNFVKFSQENPPNQTPTQPQSMSQSHSDVLFGQPSQSQGIGEKAVRGATNLFGNIGAGLQKAGGVLAGLAGKGLDYLTGAPLSVMQTGEVLGNLYINKDTQKAEEAAKRTYTSSYTGEQITPWFYNNIDKKLEATPEKVAMSNTAEALRRTTETGMFTVNPVAGAGLKGAAMFGGAIGTLGGARDIMKQGEEKILTGEAPNIPQALGSALEEGVIATALDLVFRGAGKAWKGLTKTSDAVPAAQKGVGQEINKAKGIYRQVLNPTKNDLKTMEIRKPGSLESALDRIAENRIIIEEASDGKMSTLSGIEKLKSSADEVYDALNGIFKKDPRIFSVTNIVNRAKTYIDDLNRLGIQKQAMKDEIDFIVSAEKLVDGTTGDVLNALKSNLWKISKFDSLAQQRPAIVDASRQLGRAIKESIEEAYIDVRIKDLNELAGSYHNAIKLLENAHGRKVAGSTMKSAITQLTYMVAGSKIPVVGPIIMQPIGERAAKFLTNPERLTKKASGLVKGEGKTKAMVEEAGKVPPFRPAGLIEAPKLRMPFPERSGLVSQKEAREMFTSKLPKKPTLRPGFINLSAIKKDLTAPKNLNKNKISKAEQPIMDEIEALRKKGLKPISDKKMPEGKISNKALLGVGLLSGGLLANQVGNKISLQNKLKEDQKKQLNKKLSELNVDNKILEIKADLAKEFKKRGIPEEFKPKDINKQVTNEDVESFVKNIKVKIDHKGQIKQWIKEKEGVDREGLAKLNNNPGNLKYAEQPNAEKNGIWAKFPTPELGFRALIKDVQAKQKRDLSLAKLIYIYAPPEDGNDTELYINTVADWANIKRDELASKINSIELAKFIALFESQTIIEE